MLSWNWQKIKQKLSNTLGWTFAFWKLFAFSIQKLSSKNSRRYSKKYTKNKCVCYNEVIDDENEAENEK